MLFLSIARPAEPLQLRNDDNLALELRLDLFPNIDIAAIRDILHLSARPIMLTVRQVSHGGKFLGTESERMSLITQLLELTPPYFDLEYDMDASFLHEVINKFPGTKFILSYHNFDKIPADLDDLYRCMQAYAAFGYKIAAVPHSTTDAFKMLLFARTHPAVNVICMGENGAFSRILGPVAGNSIGYASLNSSEQTAPGQLSVDDLVNIYRYPALNSQTTVYGLIGSPVIHSQGHRYHNAVFKQMGLNAVYVKMLVGTEELKDFIPLAKKMGVQGLSVTAPLKEAIMPFVDELDEDAERIGAVNTLRFVNGVVKGTNTDGVGALDAIEGKMVVHGKKIVIVGAGGAARSIAFEAKKRGAEVVVLNRTVKRAQKLGKDLGCDAGGLSDIPRYDIIVNCSTEPMSIDPKSIQAGTLAMDIVYHPRETDFLKEAAAKGCQVVYGEEMFLNQAARQTAFWMDPVKGK